MYGLKTVINLVNLTTHLLLLFKLLFHLFLLDSICPTTIFLFAE